MSKIRIPGPECKSPQNCIHYKVVGNCFGSNGYGYCNASIDYETNRLLYLIKKRLRLNK